ncbi:polysaccharide deacetylase family protein [bacterium]|nr:polysaccharide deacetylase family protein [bacterium]
MKHAVDVLITCDIDPTPEANIDDKRIALRRCADLFNKYSIKSTFYTVANNAHEYSAILNDLTAEGHEIGCHGLTHSDDEEFSTMPLETQTKILKEATEKIKKVIGQAPVSFRGPRVKTSAATQEVLEDLAYLSDSSVCPQRIDFISSNLINPHWITAPRLPYRPNIKNAFKKGDRNLWVIPVSAIILPFISGMLYFFGYRFMRLFFNILAFESRLTGKPIVYLLHPAEFAPMTKAVHHKTSLKAILARGFYFRSKLKLRHTCDTRFKMTEKFLSYISQFNGVSFYTAHSYIEKIENV